MRHLLALLVLAAPAFAQLRETIDVSVLELEVAVLDRSGKPVEGLARGDFEVRLANRSVDVTNFYAVRRGAVLDEAEPGKQELKVETTIPTTLVIVLDDAHLGGGAKTHAIEALRGYVKANVGPTTSAMLARWNGANLDVRTRPTERPGLLLAEIDRLAAQPAQLLKSDRHRLIQLIDSVVTTPPGRNITVPIMEPDQLRHEVLAYAEHEVRQVERTLAGLREVVQLAAAFDGRRAVLYLSEGLPLSAGAEIFDYWDKATTAMDPGLNMDIAAEMRNVMSPLDRTRYDRSPRFRDLVREAQRANVLFYAIDAGGIRANDLSGVDAPLSVAKLDPMMFRLNLQDGIRFLANETGGRFIANENDLGRALTVMSEQYTTYYSLGVRAPSTTRLEKVRAKVKNRPELRVVTARYRRAMSREENLERSVRSHLYTRATENPLRVTLAVGTAVKRDGRCRIPVTIHPNAGAIWFALLDERMQESDVRRADSNEIALGVKPGTYVLSVAVVSPMGETSYLQHDIDCR